MWSWITRLTGLTLRGRDEVLPSLYYTVTSTHNHHKNYNTYLCTFVFLKRFIQEIPTFSPFPPIVPIPPGGPGAPCQSNTNTDDSNLSDSLKFLFKYFTVKLTSAPLGP